MYIRPSLCLFIVNIKICFKLNKFLIIQFCIIFSNLYYKKQSFHIVINFTHSCKCTHVHNIQKGFNGTLNKINKARNVLKLKFTRAALQTPQRSIIILMGSLKTSRILPVGKCLWISSSLTLHACNGSRDISGTYGRTSCPR